MDPQLIETVMLAAVNVMGSRAIMRLLGGLGYLKTT